ncbi:MAG: hypothetical protein ACTSQS_00495 [Promethearchaeota archaeon]
MLTFIVVLTISVLLTVLFLVLTIKYKSYLDKIYQKIEEEKKEKSLAELLDKYVVEEEKDIMKEKLAKIAEIIKETEKEIEEVVKQKVEVAEAQLKAKGKEREIILKARDELLTFESGFRPAMPQTEEERLRDMEELQTAISILESFDEEMYKVGKSQVDAGLGMFYDKMSRRFKSIISEHKLDEAVFIPIHKLKYHAFQEIRNIKNKDILPILKIMKETGLLKDIVEINSTLQLIIFGDKTPKFTNPEKVLLSFAFEEDYLTIQRLMEITEWSENYAERIINGLVKKGFATYIDNVIKIDGFGHSEERKKWREVIDKHIEEEKRKEEERKRKQEERKRLLREKLAKVEKAKIPEKKVEEPVKEISTSEIIESLDEISPVDEEPTKIKFDKKPQVKSLPSKKDKKVEPIKIVPKKEIKKEKPKKGVSIKKEKIAKKGKEEDLGDLAKTLDALDAFLTDEDLAEMKKKEKELQIEISEEELSYGEEERDLEDLVPEKILQYHEKYSLINGGLVQYEKIKEFVEKELGEVPEDLLKGMLSQLKKLQMIQEITKIGKHEFYIFKDLKLGIHEKNFIRVCINKKPLNKEEIMKALHWDEERTLNVMKQLQEKGIIKLEKDKIIIPGAIQK